MRRSKENEKIICKFLTVLTLLGTTPVFALNEESNTQIVERFEDGSYIEVTIEEIPTLTRSNTKRVIKQHTTKHI